MGSIEDLNKRMWRDLGQPCPYHVGEVVYYLSPATEYAVRKSRVKEIQQDIKGYGYLRTTMYKLLLENGDMAKESHVFPTRQKALESISEVLQQRLSWNRAALENLKREIAKEETILKIINQNIKKEN